jgi:Cation/multidrug efflux pump
MNVSAPFIRRPIGTILLGIGVFLVGVVAYFRLPVASLPSIDFPAVFINTQYPGASPEIMAATVAAPIERHVGEIAGLTELTSVSSLGNTVIIALFDLSRNVDGAARDVQAALNAAATDLPTVSRKSRSSAKPIRTTRRFSSSPSRRNRCRRPPSTTRRTPCCCNGSRR